MTDKAIKTIAQKRVDPAIEFKYGMAIDLDLCTGCGACAVACMSENNIYVLEDETDKVRSVSWIKIHRLTNQKPYPDTKACFLPAPCMHCDKDTPCVEVCPVRATTKDEPGGIVSQIASRCIGCRYCMAACPYHSRSFNWFDPWPKGDRQAAVMAKSLNPEVAPRTRGVVEKCTFCHHRLMAAKAKAHAKGVRGVSEQDFQPACVSACPAKAMAFGEITNPNHTVYKWVNDPRSFRLLEKFGIEPKVFYLSSDDWVKQVANGNITSGGKG